MSVFFVLESALKADLAGQVSSKVLDSGYLAGFDGALDFPMGRGCRKAGDFAVTEHRMADPRGVSVARRARSRICVATPLHQGEFGKRFALNGETR